MEGLVTKIPAGSLPEQSRRERCNYGNGKRWSRPKGKKSLWKKKSSKFHDGLDVLKHPSPYKWHHSAQILENASVAAQ